MTLTQRILYAVISAILMSTAYAKKPSYVDVLNSVDKNFPLIIAAKQAIAKAKAGNYAAHGAFDPVIKSEALASTAGPYKNHNLDVEYRIPTISNGGYVFTGYRYGQGDYPIYNQGYLTENKGEIRTGVAFPLLNGREVDANRTSLALSKVNIHIQQENLRLTRLETKLEASVAYWRWRGELLKLHLAKQLLALASERQKAIEKRFEHGDAAKVEVVENDRFILQRRAAVVLAQRALQKAAFYLSMYFRDETGKPIIITSASHLNELPDIHFSTNSTQYFLDRLALLVDQYPRQKIFNYERQMINANLRLADNTRLPRLDMSVYYAQDMGRNNAHVPINDKSLNLGFNFSFPVLQRRAYGDIEQNKRALNELTEKQTFLHEKLSMQLRDSINQAIADKQEAELARDEVKLSYQVERAEIKRFVNGDSTLFLVNQREQSTFDSRIRAVNAAINFFLSKSNLASFCAFERECLKVLKLV